VSSPLCEDARKKGRAVWQFSVVLFLLEVEERLRPGLKREISCSVPKPCGLHLMRRCISITYPLWKDNAVMHCDELTEKMYPR